MSLRKYGILLILSVFVGFQSDALTGYLTMVIGSLFVAYISFVLKIRAVNLRARDQRRKAAKLEGEPTWSEVRNLYKYFFLLLLSITVGIYNGTGTGFLTFIIGLPICICLGAFLRGYYSVKRPPSLTTKNSTSEAPHA